MVKLLPVPAWPSMIARPSAPVAWRKARACSRVMPSNCAPLSTRRAARRSLTVRACRAARPSAARSTCARPRARCASCSARSARRLGRRDARRRHGRGSCRRIARRLDAALLHLASRANFFRKARSSCAAVKVERCLVIASSTRAGVARAIAARNSFAVLAARAMMMPPCSRS